MLVKFLLQVKKPSQTEFLEFSVNSPKGMWQMVHIWAVLKYLATTKMQISFIAVAMEALQAKLLL